MAYHDFTEMPVWQLATEIVKDVYKLTEKLPKREDYALCGQLRSAAVSISGNIAEGFGRGHKKDKINFYYYSRGSACEVRSHLLAGKAANYFEDQEIEIIIAKCLKISEELNRIIKGLNT
ncbi:MAG: four helix bundle protein [Chitinophagaceae bacterium]